MNEPQHTLTACAHCQRGYRARDMYEVQGYEQKILICGPCYDKAQYGENLEERQ